MSERMVPLSIRELLDRMTTEYKRTERAFTVQEGFKLSRYEEWRKKYDLGELSGSKLLGSEIVIPKAICRDVFNPNSAVSVSVRDVNGNTVTSKDGVLLNKVSCDREYTIKLSTVGTYTISYTTKELGWNENNEKDSAVLIRVIDNVAPTASISSNPVKTVKRGEVISMPSITATDNISAPEKLNIIKMVETPGGRMVLIDATDKFIPMYVGEYRFIIFVEDEAGNFVMLRFNVAVTE